MKTGRLLMCIGYVVLAFELVSYLLPIIGSTFSWSTVKLTWIGVLDGGLFQGLALIGVGKLLTVHFKNI